MSQDGIGSDLCIGLFCDKQGLFCDSPVPTFGQLLSPDPRSRTPVSAAAGGTRADWLGALLQLWHVLRPLRDVLVASNTASPQLRHPPVLLP
jgi:hypothetical protein